MYPGLAEDAVRPDHWYAMEYALTLKPEDVEAKTHVAVHMMLWQNEQLKENQRAKAKAAARGRVVLVVVHEPPDNAGTGVVAAHRVREYNRENDDGIAYYLYPVIDENGKFRPFVEDRVLAGCPCIRCPPDLFQSTVRRLAPELIEFHHTLLWGDDILRVDTPARKQLYLHDRWMWSVHPHQDGEFRDTRKHLEGIDVSSATASGRAGRRKKSSE